MSAKKAPSIAETHVAADGIPRLGLSVQEAAMAAGLSLRFMWDEIKNGKVRTKRAGRRVIVTVAALNEYLNAKN